MKLAIIGYGNMGKEIERLALERQATITRIFTSAENPGGIALTRASLEDAEVCIDFSAPTAVRANIDAVAATGKNMVVGTTGWYNGLQEVRKLVEARGIGLVYSPNFSLGMNLFYHVVASAARSVDSLEMYDVAVSEIHHRGKSDSPSGTALALGQIIMQNLHRKREIMHKTPDRALRPEELHISSTRVGNATGTHSVLFDSEADSIELTHVAKNRSGFALGALVAAEWLRGKKGIFTMKDVLGR